MIMVSDKFVLNFTPTGLIPTREMTPYVPISPEEIAADVLRVSELGVTMVHLHAREPAAGGPAYKKEIYGEIIQGIRRQRRDLILCVSTSGRYFNEFEMRSDCLELEGAAKPDLASLTLSSLNFNKQASVNEPAMIQNLARKMLDKGIKRELPEESMWSVGGVGEYQLQLNVMSLVAGGGVRIGLEDNIWYDVARTRLATNYDLVERIVKIGGALGKEPLHPGEARDLLQLKG